MGRYPTKSLENIYCRCRKEAAKFNQRLFSREGASEALGISVSSLSDYELGNSKPPVDVVVRMADLYNAPEIKNNYCCYECPIGFEKNLALQIESVEGTALKLVKVLNVAKISNIREELIDISADGKIDESEMERWQSVIEVLDEVSKEIGQLKLLAEKINKE